MLKLLRLSLVVQLLLFAVGPGCTADPDIRPLVGPSSGEAQPDAGGPAFGGNGQTSTSGSPDATAPGTTAPDTAAPDKPDVPGGTVDQDDERDTQCGYGVVYGLICSKDDQAFVNGARVWIETVDCADQPVLIETFSDDNGYYTLSSVPSGLQTIRVEKADWGKEYTVLVKDSMLTDVTGVGHKECFKVVDACPMGGVFGTVCHQDGTPNEVGVDVAIDGVGCDGEPVHLEGTAEADGTFFFGNLASGTWSVTAAAGGQWLTQEVQVFEAVVDLKELGLELCFDDQECGYGTLTGYACTPNPGDDFFIGGAQVDVFSTDCEGAPFHATGWTDGDGLYVFSGVPGGPAQIKVQKDGLLAEYLVNVPTGGTANAPDLVPDVCFPQQCIPGAITGFVCAPGLDSFIGGAKVWIDTVDCGGQPLHLESFSDANGVYILTSVPQGVQIVSVEKGGFFKQYAVDVPPGQVVQAQDLVDDLCFPPGQDECASGDITGTVCAPNDVMDIGGAQVWVQTFDCKGAPVLVDAFSDAAGNYILKNVPAGQVKVFIQKGQFSHEYTLVVPANGVVHAQDVVDQACFPSNSVKFAVVTGQWDHIETILSQLGVDHDLFDGALFTSAAKTFLTDFQKMSEYDAIFFDCGSQHYDILTFNQQLITTNLSNFVANGGSVYASDWAFVYVEWPWSGSFDFYGGNFNETAPKVGAQGNLTGTVVDGQMAAYLGKGSVSINYNLSSWVVMSGAPPGTTTHITGPVPQVGGGAPLMVSTQPLGPQAGRVLYTTFHNETQPTQDMLDILNFMVFSL
ncbi:MAG: hypothetical protein ACI9WU_000718 [Myxococcota bacterium]|jgi:hypothetical protein